MQKKLSSRYKFIFRRSSVLLLSLFLLNCNDETKTEVIELNDITPKAKGDYNYSDSSVVQDTVQDNFVLELEKEFNTTVSSLDPKEIRFQTTWKYIPDRLDSDSTLSKLVIIDSTIIQFKSWYFNDSLKTVNAFYNWLDCFGDDCAGISIGDSVNVAQGSFLLLQDDQQIQFMQSQKRINHRKWKNYFSREKNTPWNYVILQSPGGEIIWKEKPD